MLCIASYRRDIGAFQTKLSWGAKLTPAGASDLAAALAYYAFRFRGLGRASV
jgi:hypothetical protein